MGGGCDLRAYESPVCNGAAHAGNEGHASTVPEPDHLARDGLGRHEDTRDVDLKHLVAVLGSVLDRRGLLLDARRGDQAVQPVPLRGDALDYLIKVVDVPHVDLVVAQRDSQVVPGPLSHDGEGRVRRGLGEPVNGMDCDSLCQCPPRVGQGTRQASCLPVAPASSNASACTSPRPLAAPVTITTFPLRENSGSVGIAKVSLLCKENPV